MNKTEFSALCLGKICQRIFLRDNSLYKQIIDNSIGWRPFFDTVLFKQLYVETVTVIEEYNFDNKLLKIVSKALKDVSEEEMDTSNLSFYFHYGLTAVGLDSDIFRQGALHFEIE